MGVKVVADTHVLVFYLFTPDRLTDTALDALLHAEDTDGIVVSAATFTDLWYASRKTSSAAIAPGVYQQIRPTVLDPTTNLLLQPISAATIGALSGRCRWRRCAALSTGSSSPPRFSSRRRWSPPTVPSPPPAQPRSSGERRSSTQLGRRSR